MRLLVIAGVHGLGPVFLKIRFQIHSLAGDLVILPGQRRVVAVHEGAADHLVQTIYVQAPVRIAHVHNQLSGVFVEAHLGGNRLLLHLRRCLLDDGTDVVRVQVHHGLQVDIMLRVFRPEEGCHCGEGIAASAELHGLVDGFFRVQRHIGLLRTEGQSPVGKLDLQRGGGVGCRHGFIHGLYGLLAVHTAHVDPGHIDVGIDGAAMFQNQAIAKHAQHQRKYQRTGHTAQNQPNSRTGAGGLFRLAHRRVSRRHGMLSGLRRVHAGIQQIRPGIRPHLGQIRNLGRGRLRQVRLRGHSPGELHGGGVFRIRRGRGILRGRRRLLLRLCAHQLVQPGVLHLRFPPEFRPTGLFEFTFLFNGDRSNPKTRRCRGSQS